MFFYFSFALATRRGIIVDVRHAVINQCRLSEARYSNRTRDAEGKVAGDVHGTLKPVGCVKFSSPTQLLDRGVFGPLRYFTGP